MAGARARARGGPRPAAAGRPAPAAALLGLNAHDFAHAYPGGIYWLNFAGFAPDNPVSEQAADNAWLGALAQIFAGELEILRDAEGKPLPAPKLRAQLKDRLGAEPYLWVLDNVPELSPLDGRAQVLKDWRAPGAAGAR